MTDSVKEDETARNKRCKHFAPSSDQGQPVVSLEALCSLCCLMAHSLGCPGTDRKGEGGGGG
ncbi:hypothetical protein E2C01_041732 [Portunus trituberculatus]|uniref:Uncharacterized protein n=1 Tax=Portunus trituberculatus TaxID=210409 RepID=A0A5B7FKN2_PORTR|nr:hypothetical protein [Portunus trituberculatus]